jgi:hypothetical protein
MVGGAALSGTIDFRVIVQGLGIEPCSSPGAIIVAVIIVQITGSPLEFGQSFAEGTGQFRQTTGSENDQGQGQYQKQFGGTYIKHAQNLFLMDIE